MSDLLEEPDEFYEDDEPIEDVIEAFRVGIPGVTAPPMATYVAWVPAVNTVTNEPRLADRQPVQV